MAPGSRSQHELDEPHRLAIVVSVFRRGALGAAFPELAAELGLSAGNLACHLRRLVRAGLVRLACNAARGRARHTRVHATTATRTHLQDWSRILRDRLAALDGALAETRDQVVDRERVVEPPSAPAGRSPTPSTPAVVPEPTAATRSLVEERFDGPD